MLGEPDYAVLCELQVPNVSAEKLLENMAGGGLAARAGDANLRRITLIDDDYAEYTRVLLGHLNAELGDPGTGDADEDIQDTIDHLTDCIARSQ